MRIWRWFLLGLLGLPAVVGAQSPPVPLTAVTPAALGYRHLVVMFGRDSVNVLVQFKKGEESVKKPLLLWLQGSLPRPLILYDEQGPFRYLRLRPATGADLVGCALSPSHHRQTGHSAVVQSERPRRLMPALWTSRRACHPLTTASAITSTTTCVATRRVALPKKQSWVDKTRVVVGGHSEGSSIVARLAAVPGLLTHAVYLSGSPLAASSPK
jgi:hypothetical protein